MNNSVTYQVNLKVNGGDIIGQVTSEINQMAQSTQKATKSFGDCFKSFLAFETAINQISNLRVSLDELNAPGIQLNSNMAELSAITNVTGDALDSIEKSARATAKTFGTDASANVESYKLILSQLDPTIAKNNKAMKLMGDNVNILSKQLGGDTVLATNVLTTSMNQFGVSTKDPIQAAKVMGEMMNTMSAGHSQRFREILFGVGYAGKAVFHNIGVFVKRLWNLVIKPIVTFIWNIFKDTFQDIWNITKKVINGIATAFKWLWSAVIKPISNWIYQKVVGVFVGIWNTVKWVFSLIAEFGSSVWNWLIEVFGSFGTWINETLIQPIYDAFSKVWDWISGLLDKVVAKMMSVLQPIIDIWNKLFSSEGTANVKVAYKTGTNVGRESFNRDQKKKTDKDKEPQKVELVKNKFDLKDGIPKTPTLGGSAVKSIQSKSVGGKSDNGNSKVTSLTIGKMMENFNIHMNTNGNNIDKTQLLNAVKEVLLTATQDFALATE